MDFNFKDTSRGQFDEDDLNAVEKAGLAQLRLFTQSFLYTMVYPTPLGPVPVDAFLHVAIQAIEGSSNVSMPFGILNRMANQVLNYALEQGFLTETGDSPTDCECGKCGDTVEVNALGLAFVGPPQESDPNNN